MALRPVSVRRCMEVIAVVGLDCGLWKFGTGRNYYPGLEMIGHTFLLALAVALVFGGRFRRFALGYGVTALLLVATLLFLGYHRLDFLGPVIVRYDAYLNDLGGRILWPAMVRVDLSPTHIEYRIGWAASLKFEAMAALPILSLSIIGGLVALIPFRGERPLNPILPEAT